MAEVQPNHLFNMQSDLQEAPTHPLFIHPSAPSSDDENLSRTSSFTATDRDTFIRRSPMTTMSGSIVTTVSSQSRRQSIIVPHMAVTPSRRQSLNADVNLPIFSSSSQFLSPHTASNAILADRLQTMQQQILSLQVSLGCLEEQNKDSSRQHELQNERTTTLERSIAENHTQSKKLHTKLAQTEQNLNSKLDKTMQSMVSFNKDTLWMVAYFIPVALFSFLIGRLL